MPINITVKNIPDHSYNLLKQIAASHRRSVNKEIISLIEKATGSNNIDPEQYLAFAKKAREKTKHFLLTPEILQNAKEAGRT